MKKIELPCLPNDTVMAYLGDSVNTRFTRNRKREKIFSECIITNIEINKDYPEPIFTAVCYEKAEFGHFWASEFGKEIFTLDQYYDLLAKQSCKR